MLNKTEKEQRVIELYEQGKTIREIAQDVSMSFGDIGAIIKKVTGLQNISTTVISLVNTSYSWYCKW
jgi:DNA-binding NarL/FixJ family response regulator